MESLNSDGSATSLLIIWVEKIIPLTMKSKQKPYPSIVFLSILDTDQIRIRYGNDESIRLTYPYHLQQTRKSMC